jgi:hypothetical protein
MVSGVSVRSFLLNEGAKVSLPTAIPYIFRDRVIHPEFGVWTGRFLCTWCDGWLIYPPDVPLTQSNPDLTRFLRYHAQCDQKGRARLRKEQGRDTLRRELGTTHFHNGL